MINTLDHLIIAVKDLDEAENNYKKIFGMDPVWRGEHKELAPWRSSGLLFGKRLVTSVGVECLLPVGLIVRHDELPFSHLLREPLQLVPGVPPRAPLEVEPPRGSPHWLRVHVVPFCRLREEPVEVVEQLVLLGRPPGHRLHTPFQVLPGGTDAREFGLGVVRPADDPLRLVFFRLLLEGPVDLQIGRASCRERV